MKSKKKAARKPAKKAARRVSRRRSATRRPSRSSSFSGNSPIKTNKVRMKVVGVGGAGGNVIMRMEEGSRGVSFVAVNTDIQDLEKSAIKNKIHIGKILTRGMGAGMNPELGKQAADESRLEITEALKDTDMVFLTAGFGGGTGSGAAPVVAEIARELGALTIGVVTKPFAFEGAERMRIAEEAIHRIKDKVDALLVVPNDRIFSIIDAETSMMKAFEKIDFILKSAVHGITEIISSAGIVNVDFADLKAIMSGAGTAVIGVGTASGKDRAVKATNEAINSPLLESSISGAKGVIFCIAANKDLRMMEIDEAAKIITAAVDPGAKIIFGAYNDRKLKPGQIKVVIIAAGFENSGFKSRGETALFGFENKNDSANSVKVLIEAEPKDQKTGKHTPKDQKPDDDHWDIPAFLRKKRR